MSLPICFDDSNDVKFKRDVLNEVIENRGDVAGRARTRHVYLCCAAGQASMSMRTGFCKFLVGSRKDLILLSCRCCSVLIDREAL